MWQVIARVINQGSRLSAVRLARVHAAGAVLDLKRGFDENDLYKNLAWLAENQSEIEKKLFKNKTWREKAEAVLVRCDKQLFRGRA